MQINRARAYSFCKVQAVKARPVFIHFWLTFYLTGDSFAPASPAAATTAPLTSGDAVPALPPRASVGLNPNPRPAANELPGAGTLLLEVFWRRLMALPAATTSQHPTTPAIQSCIPSAGTRSSFLRCLRDAHALGQPRTDSPTWMDNPQTSALGPNPSRDSIRGA